VLESCWKNFQTDSSLIQCSTDFCNRSTQRSLLIGNKAAADEVRMVWLTQMTTLTLLVNEFWAGKMCSEPAKACVNLLIKQASTRRQCSESFTRSQTPMVWEAKHTGTDGSQQSLCQITDKVSRARCFVHLVYGWKDVFWTHICWARSKN